ncbi:MarR family transcriptional regulator [Streptomyces sp. TRM49041]|uniref:MarR family transcriptional regulator n=1 Tax=Streptomyces sp. TRM49041 TaxID=2603216 RepID=UPI0011ED1DE8|nr:MarR family transcriptional regulator [Streptomyces sp. TRM49041]
MTQKPAASLAPAVADPNATDEELAAQPVGYWTGVVHGAVVAHLRDAMARVDVTQPMWWSINRVLAAGEKGATRDEVAARLADVAADAYEIPRAVDQLLHRGWLAPDEAGALHLTADGLAAHARVKHLVTELRARLHEGVPDEEYAAALRVLRRINANVARASAAD